LGPDAAQKGFIGMVSQTVDQDVDVNIDVGMTVFAPPCSAAKQPKHHSSEP
jgi:hypothetical protein